MIYLGPHGLAAVAWLGFDSDHGQLSWQLDHLWLVITESFPLHYFSVFICWMLTHWAFIFFSVPETLEDMSNLIATDLWAHGPVAWKAQRTAIKQQQRLKDAYPALSADLLSILFTESAKFLCQFIFFSFHFYFLFFLVISNVARNHHHHQYLCDENHSISAETRLKMEKLCPSPSFCPGFMDGNCSSDHPRCTA